MSKRLQSVDLELYGVQHTYEFEPPIVVDSDDEVEVGTSILSDVTSLEVTLVDAGAVAATVSVSFIIRGSVDVDIEAYTPWESEDEVLDAAREDDSVYDAIVAAVDNGSADIDIDYVELQGAFDEDGNDVEW